MYKPNVIITDVSFATFKTQLTIVLGIKELGIVGVKNSEKDSQLIHIIPLSVEQEENKAILDALHDLTTASFNEAVVNITSTDYGIVIESKDTPNHSIMLTSVNWNWVE